jgi:anti-sigma factor RsiW
MNLLHKYVSGRLREARSRLTTRSTRTRAKAARAG